MTLKLVQGFELYETTNDPTVPYLDDDMVTDLLGFRAPEHATTAAAVWFQDSTAALKGLSVQATTKRIDGKALMIERPYEGATYDQAFNGKYDLDLTKAFAQTQQAAIGLAVYYDTAPANNIPLLQFLGDDGTGEAEQCSIWITTDGKIHVSDDTYDVSTLSTVQTSSPYTGGTSASGVFRFGRWVYIEVHVDYTGVLPVITIDVNGTNVLTFTSSSGQKVTGAFLDAVSIINPINNYWGATSGYTMYLDDIYISNDLAQYGPQHIVAIWPSADSQAEWATTGANRFSVLDTVFDPATVSAYVSNDDPDDHDIYDVDNPAADVISITAVAPSVIASIDSGSGTLKLPILEGVTQLNKSVSLDSANPEFKQVIFETNADADAWTNALVDSMQMGLDLS